MSYRRDYARRTPPNHARRSATPPPYERHDRETPRDAALGELFRVREDIGALRSEVAIHKDQLAESAGIAAQLADRVKPIVDDWDTTASQGEVSSVREQTAAVREDLQDAVDRIRTLEDTLKDLTDKLAAVEKRYDNGGASFKRLQERVTALEAYQDSDRGPLAARISAARKPVARRTRGAE